MCFIWYFILLVVVFVIVNVQIQIVIIDEGIYDFKNIKGDINNVDIGINEVVYMSVDEFGGSGGG